MCSNALYGRIMAEDLTLEILKRMQVDMSDMVQEIKQINTRLSSIDSHMTGFLIASTSQNEQISSIKARLDRIEKRLELHE